MSEKWILGQRVYYISNNKILNSWIVELCSNDLVLLKDGRMRNLDSIYKTRQLAKESIGK